MSVLEKFEKEYLEYAAGQKEQERLAEQERMALLLKEREEAARWLLTQMPEEIVSMIDFSAYSHAMAGRAGCLLEINGDVFPVSFILSRWIVKHPEGGDTIHFEIDKSGFAVPTQWSISLDDCGKVYVSYNHGLVRFQDFSLAIGYAVSLWKSEHTAIEKKKQEIELKSELKKISQEENELPGRWRVLHHLWTCRRRLMMAITPGSNAGR